MSALAASRRRTVVVFDLDGTLVDSAPDILTAMNRLLAGEQRRPLGLDEMKTMIGEGSRRAVEKALAATGKVPEREALDGLTARYVALYSARVAVETRPFPGTETALAGLAAAGCALGICTNKPRLATLELLAALGLARYFGAVTGGDDIPGVRKPDPKHLLHVLDQLGRSAAEAVMVGDSEHDIAAAKGLGVPAIAVGWGYSRVPAAALGADAVIGRFEDLPAALARLS